MIAENEINNTIEGLINHFKFMVRENRNKEFRIYNYIQLAECYLLQGNDNRALKALYYTFLLSEPLPTVCFKIASIYYDRKEHKLAKYWIELAVNKEMEKAK